MEVVSMPNDSQIQFMAIKQVNGAKYCPGIKASPEEYANDQFEEMITSINSGTFQPDQDVCGTYLCSEPSTKWTKSKVSWFRTGQIDMADMSVIQEHLPRALKKEKPLRVQVQMLADTGATKPMLSQKLIDDNKYLQTCLTYKIKPQPVTMGDNCKVHVDMCMQFTITGTGNGCQLCSYAINISTARHTIENATKHDHPAAHAEEDHTGILSCTARSMHQ